MRGRDARTELVCGIKVCSGVIKPGSRTDQQARTHINVSCHTCPSEVGVHSSEHDADDFLVRPLAQNHGRIYDACKLCKWELAKLEQGHQSMLYLQPSGDQAIERLSMAPRPLAEVAAHICPEVPDDMHASVGIAAPHLSATSIGPDARPRNNQGIQVSDTGSVHSSHVAGASQQAEQETPEAII